MAPDYQAERLHLLNPDHYLHSLFEELPVVHHLLTRFNHYNWCPYCPLVSWQVVLHHHFHCLNCSLHHIHRRTFNIVCYVTTISIYLFNYGLKSSSGFCCTFWRILKDRIYNFINLIY